MWHIGQNMLESEDNMSYLHGASVLFYVEPSLTACVGDALGLKLYTVKLIQTRR